MDIHHLITFKKLVELESYTETAEALGYTQSTITSHIQEIEKHLGIKLFDRIGRKIYLTDSGKELLKYTIQIVAIYEKIEDIPNNLGEIKGTLKIAAPESLTIYRLEPILKEYRKQFPRVELTLVNFTCNDSRNKLFNGEVDIAFLLMPEFIDSDLIVDKLVVEPLVLVTSPDKNYTSVYDIQKEHVLNECIIYNEKGCCYRTTMENYLTRSKITPINAMELWSVESIKRCVMSGLGISLLPLITVEKEITEKKLKVVKFNEVEGIYGQLAYHKNKCISPALKEFIQLTKLYSEKW